MVAHEAVEENAYMVCALAGSLLIGGGVAGVLLTHDGNDIIKASVEAEELRYLCEGTSSAVCSYSGKRRDWQGSVLQLPKDAESGVAPTADAIVRRVSFQRAVARHCFDRSAGDAPTAVALREATVRAIDAAILSHRPQEQRGFKLTPLSHPDFPGRGLAVRMTNLMEAPALSAGAARLPLVTVEFWPGCGLKELDSLPSRHAIAARVAAGTGKQKLAGGEDLFLKVFSGKKEEVVAALKERLDVARVGAACLRIFVDGRPLFPAALPGTPSLKGDKGGGLLEEALPGASLALPVDLAEAVGGLLTARRCRILADLEHLQGFAAGESEKIAARLLEDLRSRGGQEAVEAVGSAAALKAAAQAAGRADGRGRLAGMKAVKAHEQNGRAFMASASWSPRELAAVQRWLSLFLLGRAAFDARLLVSFVKPEAAAAPDALSQLRSARFKPLSEWTGGQAAPKGDVWVCVTAVGFEPRGVGEIPQMATELDELVRLYQEMTAAAS